jgi:hypothetical protein
MITKEHKIDVLKTAIQFDIEKTVFPSTESLGIPNINTVNLELAVEIIPEEYFFSTNLEFFIISSFDVKGKTEDKKKFIFHKILFMNSNIKEIFDNNNMNKTNIITILTNDDEIKPISVFKRHLESVLHDGIKYRILKDNLNFNKFFINKEIKEYETND